MRQHLPMIAIGLGFGAGAASAQDVVQWGLDGLNLLLIMVSSLLVYFGGKGMME